MIRINQCQYLSSACPTPNDARTAWERYWIFQLMRWHIKVVGASQVHFTLCKHMIMPAVYQCFYINDVRNKSDLNASRGQSSMSNALLMLCCSFINSRLFSRVLEIVLQLVASKQSKNTRTYVTMERYFLHHLDLIYKNKLVRGGSVSGEANTNRH